MDSNGAPLVILSLSNIIQIELLSLQFVTTRNNHRGIIQLKSSMSPHFHTKDHGQLSYFLVIDSTYLRSHFHMKNYDL